MKTRECMKWLWKASEGIRGWVVLASLAGIMHVLVSLAFVWVCKSLVDAVTGNPGADLTWLIAAMASCMLLQVLFGSVESWVSSRADVILKNTLRHRLFVMMMEARWEGKETYHSGDALNRVMEDVRVAAESLTRSVPAVIVAGVQFICAFAFLFILAPGLAWAIPGLLIAMLLISRTYIRRMRRLTKDIRSAESSVQSLMQESLQNRLLIHTLERTPYISDALSVQQDELQGHVIDKTNYSVFTSSFVRLGFASGYAVAFLWGVFGIRSGAATFGMMTAFLQLVGQIQRPIMNLSRQLPSLINSLTSAERLTELSEMPSEDSGEPVRLAGCVGVCFDDVSYAYPDSAGKIFDGFTHDFKPGTMTALVGETGVGKSTLMRLMLALLRPEKGRIRMYDENISVDVSPRTRCNIVYVPQGNTLMSGTIRENLLLGNPEATDEEMCEALYLAAAEFVMQLPDGLDTVCGEKGAGLSEGQAQRIAIARAMLRKGGLLLMDEPTASLDADTEKTLLNRLAENIGGRTLVIVTHRQAAALICNAQVRL